MTRWGAGKGRPPNLSLTTRFCTSLLPPVEVSASLTGLRQQAPRQLRSCSSCCTCSRAGLSSSLSRRPWRRLGEKDLEYLELSKRLTDVGAVSLGGAAQRSGAILGRTQACCPFLYSGILRCVSVRFFCLQVEASPSGPVPWPGISINTPSRATE